MSTRKSINILLTTSRRAVGLCPWLMCSFSSSSLSIYHFASPQCGLYSAQIPVHGFHHCLVPRCWTSIYVWRALSSDIIIPNLLPIFSRLSVGKRHSALRPRRWSTWRPCIFSFASLSSLQLAMHNLLSQLQMSVCQRTISANRVSRTRVLNSTDP